jgi:hypothetical protein
MSQQRRRIPLRIATQPLWAHRLRVEAGRYLLYATAIAGLLASARYAIAPPRPSNAAAVVPAATPDPAAAGLAVLFARRYLTWNAARPGASADAIAALTGSALEPAAGIVLPPAGEQSVRWAEVVQERESQPGVRVYTVAAETDSTGIVYLTVAIAHRSGGPLAVDGYPAFVGPPATRPAIAAKGREVGNPALETVVVRALRNYLAGASGDLAADLVPGAPVAPPPNPLSLLTVQGIDWAPVGSSVDVTVTAQDAQGAQYTLTYELDVAVVQGRWEVAAVQTDPDT